MYSEIMHRGLTLVFRISPRLGWWIDRKLDLKPE
jgi:hypothetical protein